MPLLNVGRTVQINDVKQANIGATPEGRKDSSDKVQKMFHYSSENVSLLILLHNLIK